MTVDDQNRLERKASTQLDNANHTANQFSRVARGKRRHERKEQDERPSPKRFWFQMRLIPIWARIILVLLLLMGTALLGAMIGYSTIGGGEPGEIFQKETWQHIFDLVNGIETK